MKDKSIALSLLVRAMAQSKEQGKDVSVREGLMFGTVIQSSRGTCLIAGCGALFYYYALLRPAGISICHYRTHNTERR